MAPRSVAEVEQVTEGATGYGHLPTIHKLRGRGQTTDQKENERQVQPLRSRHGLDNAGCDYGKDTQDHSLHWRHPKPVKHAPHEFLSIHRYLRPLIAKSRAGAPAHNL
jgi:hypothetical protein